MGLKRQSSLQLFQVPSADVFPRVLIVRAIVVRIGCLCRRFSRVQECLITWGTQM
jgi:hypothetical protein